MSDSAVGGAFAGGPVRASAFEAGGAALLAKRAVSFQGL